MRPSRNTNAAFSINSAAAERLCFGSSAITLLADGPDTNGALSIIATTLGTGALGARPHYHRNSSETFYVSNGSVDVLVNTNIITVAQHASLTVAPNTHHAFAATPGQHAELLIALTPAIERFPYFRLLFDVTRGTRSRHDILDSQDRYDTYFVQSGIWNQTLASREDSDAEYGRRFR
jgi:mannose-6-phosphate isomerase-like protein (cupin superfamily)